jgi:TetR/AcrR family transcriptional regulator, cholesterol catabolism regulator
MSSSVAELPRRHPTERQAKIVQRLTDAAVDEIRARGYDGLTVRNVAARAGLAPATAYTYFASKDHLIAEVFWRRIRALPEPRIDKRRAASVRVTSALRDLTALLAREPQLAAASTTAMLAADADVKHIRDLVGAAIRRRLEAALGEDDGEAILMALELAVAGGMIRAGMGHLPYEELPEQIAEVAGLLMRGRS